MTASRSALPRLGRWKGIRRARRSTERGPGVGPAPGSCSRLGVRSPTIDSHRGGYHAADDRALAREPETSLDGRGRSRIVAHPASSAVRPRVSTDACGFTSSTCSSSLPRDRRLACSHVVAVIPVAVPHPGAAAAVRCRRRHRVRQPVPDSELARRLADGRLRRHLLAARPAGEPRGGSSVSPLGHRDRGERGSRLVFRGGPRRVVAPAAHGIPGDVIAVATVQRRGIGADPDLSRGCGRGRYAGHRRGTVATRRADPGRPVRAGGIRGDRADWHAIGPADHHRAGDRCGPAGDPRPCRPTARGERPGHGGPGSGSHRSRCDPGLIPQPRRRSLLGLSSAVARFTESPILGSGPGTYGVERMHDPVPIIGWLAFPDAHNILLNNLAESGIVGLVGLAATVVLVALAIRGSWRRSPESGLSSPVPCSVWRSSRVTAWWTSSSPSSG